LHRFWQGEEDMVSSSSNNAKSIYIPMQNVVLLNQALIQNNPNRQDKPGIKSVNDVTLIFKYVILSGNRGRTFGM
jgi:hypothetical protein